MTILHVLFDQVLLEDFKLLSSIDMSWVRCGPWYDKIIANLTTQQKNSIPDLFAPFSMKEDLLVNLVGQIRWSWIKAIGSMVYILYDLPVISQETFLFSIIYECSIDLIFKV